MSSTQYRPIRILRYVVVGLFLAAALGEFSQLIRPSLTAAQLHIATLVFCASIAFLLGSELNEQARALSETAAPILPEDVRVLGDGERLKHDSLQCEPSPGDQPSEIRRIPDSDRVANHPGESNLPESVNGVGKLGQAEDCLRESEAQYRLLVATIPEVVWKTDAKGNVIFVSPQVETLLGYSPSEFARQGDSLWFDSVHTDDQERVRKAFESLINNGEPYDIECRVRRKSGEWFWAHDRAVATSDPNGRRTATGILSDITPRKAGEESEKRYRSLFENMSEGFAYCEMLFDDGGFPTDFVYRAVNSAFGKLTGLHNVIGKRFTDVIPRSKDSHSELITRYSRVVLSGEPERFEIEIEALGMWFSISAYGAGTGCFVATFDNITERKQAEELLLLKTALLEAQTETTIDGILAVDDSNHIILANKQFAIQFEIPDEVLRTGDDRLVLKHVMAKIDAPDAFIERVKFLNSHRAEKSRDELRFSNGKTFERYSAPLIDSKQMYRGRIWYFRDITDRKVAEERITFLAYYDDLTGLPNRTLLHDRLSTALADARRQKYKIAVLFIDLDSFKDINDSLGHSVGDLLLQEIAKRLKRCAREQDSVARLGGDEFLMMLTHVKDVSDAAVAAERLMNSITAELVVQGHSLSIGCSIGISVFPEHGANYEILIKNADAAMYRAKSLGKNNFRFFTQDMNAQAAERLTLETSLRLALQKKELFLVYQAQLDVVSGKIIGMEALLRWQHPKLGLVPPDKFIRIAENSGLIVPIGEWVLKTACAQARKWQSEGLPAVTVAVNVSAVQFRRGDFCELVKRILHETGLAPQYLELELTESLLLADADVTFSVVQELRAMGLTLAIDDFGTGYSSFGYLKQYQVSKLKIDRLFIRDVAVSPDDAAITIAIISMAKSLHLRVLAEGVETEAQMSFLREHRCDEIQGYYFSRPLLVDQMASQLHSAQAPHVRAQASGKKS
jgi:diguanylate cyclase (GGDEF)-like protein/PAS domain S-box-containing protein